MSNIELKLQLIDQDAEKRLDNVISLLKKMEQAAKGSSATTATAAKESSQAQEKLKIETEAARLATQKAKTEQEQLKNALVGAKLEAIEAAKAQKEITEKLKQQKLAAEAVQKEMANASQSTKLFANALGSLAGFVSLTTILGTLTKIVQVGAEFQNQMNITRVMAQANTQQFAQLKNQAEQLGSSTVFSNTEIAKSQAELSRQGFNVIETLKAMPGVVNLAAASQTDLAKAANIVAGTIRGFGLDVSSSTKVADQYVVAANQSASSVESLGEAMQYVAAPAKNSNQSLEDMLSTLMLLSNNMIDGTMAGTALRQILIRLQDPPREAKVVMEQLGISVLDLNGNMKPLTTIIEDFADKTKDLDTASRNQAASMIAGIDASSSFLTIASKSKQEIESYRKAIDAATGSAKKQSDELMNGLIPAWNQMTNSVATLASTLTQILSPALTQTLNQMQQLFTTINNGFKVQDRLTKGFGVSRTTLTAGTYKYLMEQKYPGISSSIPANMNSNNFDKYLVSYLEHPNTTENSTKAAIPAEWKKAIASLSATDKAVWKAMAEEAIAINALGSANYVQNATTPIVSVQKPQKKGGKHIDFAELAGDKKEKPAYIMPVGGQLTSGYGYRINPVTGQYALHEGVDIAAPTGTAVKASANGIVTKVVKSNQGYGNRIEIDFGDGVKGLFAHLSKIGVVEGQRVQQGDVIGAVGSTGRSTGPHLHYGLSQNGNYVDPQKLTDSMNARKKGSIVGKGDTIDPTEYTKQVLEINNELDKKLEESIQKAEKDAYDSEQKLVQIKKDSEQKKEEVIAQAERANIEKLNAETVAEAEASKDQKKIIDTKYAAQKRLLDQDVKDIERSNKVATAAIDEQKQKLQDEYEEKKALYGDSAVDEEAYYDALKKLEEEKQELILAGISEIDAKQAEVHQKELDRIEEQKQQHIKAMQDVADGVSSAFSVLGDVVGGNLGKIFSNLGSQVNSLMSAITSQSTTGGKISAGASVFSSLLGSYGSGDSSGLGGVLSGSLGTAMAGATFGSMIAPGIGTVIGGAVGLVSGAVSGIFGWLFGRRLKKELKQINSYVTQYNAVLKSNTAGIQQTSDVASSAKYLDEIDAAQNDIDAQVAKLNAEAAQISSDLDPSKFKKKKAKQAAIQKRDELLEELAQQQAQVEQLKKQMEEVKKQRLALIESTKLEMLNTVGELISQNTHNPYSYDITAYSVNLQKIIQSYNKTIEDFKDSPEIKYLAQQLEEQQKKALEFQRSIDQIDIAQSTTQTLSDMKIAHLKASGASEAVIMEEEKQQAIRDLEAEMLKMRAEAVDNQEMLTKITQYEADQRVNIEKDSQDQIKQYYKQTGESIISLIKQRQNAENMFRFTRAQTQAQQRKDAVDTIDQQIRDLVSGSTLSGLTSQLSSADLETFNNFFNKNQSLFSGLYSGSTTNTTGVMETIASIQDLVSQMSSTSAISDIVSIPSDIVNSAVETVSAATQPQTKIYTQAELQQLQANLINATNLARIAAGGTAINVTINNPTTTTTASSLASQVSNATYSALQQILKNQGRLASA